MLSVRQSLAAMILGFVLLACGGALAAGPVNINTADAATLARELAGIGAAKAQAIVAYRQKHGPFRTADELALVKGIGPAIIARNRAMIRTEVKAVPKPAAEPARSPPGQR